MADEFGGEEINTDDFGGIAIEQEPQSAEPSKPSLIKEFVQGLAPIGEAQEFLKKQNEKLAPVGKALDWAGKQIGRNLKAQAFLAIGEPELAAQQIRIPEELAKSWGLKTEPDYSADPMAQGMRALPTPLRIASEATYGTAETLPRLGAMAGLAMAGIPAPYAGAAAFGLTEEGLNPKEALIGGALPLIGHQTGKVVEVMASKLGIAKDLALNIFNKLGGAAGAAGLLWGINEAEIQQLPPEQRGEARIQMAGSLLAQSVLGMTGGRTPTAKTEIKYPTGTELEQPRGAIPPRAEPVAPIERVTPERAAIASERMSRPFEGEVPKFEETTPAEKPDVTPTVTETAKAEVAATEVPKSKDLVLWGFKAGTGDLPVKLGRLTKSERKQREQQGWTLAEYAKGDEPTGLILQAKEAQAKFETITPAEDTNIGKNEAGEELYQRENGQVYRMRHDRKDRPNGYPDFGGDLAPKTEAPTPKPAETPVETPAQQPAQPIPQGPGDKLQALTAKVESGAKLTASEKKQYLKLRDEATKKEPEAQKPTTTASDEYGGMALGAGIVPPSGGRRQPVPIGIARTAPRTGVQSASLDDIYKIFEPAPKVKVPLKQRGIDIVESVRTGLSSKFRPINKLAEDISKSYGLSSSKDIAGIMEQLKGSRGKGEAQVYRFDRDVSKLVKGDEKDFNAYMFLNRSLDRLRMDERDIATAITGGNVPNLNRRSVGAYTIETLEPKLAALEQKLGPAKLAKFQQAATEYQRYLDDALRLQVESGRMSQEVYDKIKSENQFYAPFKVMKYLEESMRPEGTGAKIDTVADYTKAMTGIEDPNFKLGDMLGAARQSILISRILADKALAMRHVADLANIDTQELFIKKLSSSQDSPHGWQTVNVFDKGKKVKYATRPEVADALQLYGDTGGGIVSQVLRGMSIPFKAGATALNIPFQVSNLMADIPRQALVSKYGIKGVKDLVRYPLDFVQSLYSSMSGDLLGRENKLFLDFLDSGAAGVTIQEHLTPKALQFREPTTMSKAKRVALNIIYSPAEFAAAIEQTSKILGVKRAMRIHGVSSGAELARQIPEAITEIRRFSGSPDFGRQGKFVEAARLNLLYMFLNARIQGAVADLGRLTGRDGGKIAASTWFKVATAVGIPTAYLYYMNNSEAFKDDYDKRPQQEKDNYWLIPKSTFITNDQGERMRDYWRIPKRESAKWISNMTESALEFAQKRDPKSFYNFGQQMLEDISPVNIQGNTAQERMESVGASLNPVLKAPLEVATGRDMYRHRQLVPETMKKASPEQQYTERTAEAFKKLAVAMPDVFPEVLRSPIMLENMTRNITAGLLTQFLSRKPIEGRTPAENMALIQRFQAVPYTDNEEFTKEMNALERESADEYLARHRAATKIINDNKGKSLPDMFKSTNKDPKLMQQVVDLWMAERNGATSQDRRLIALPAKQRAEYVAKILAPLSKEEKQKKILELSKRRVLTEAVFQEMSLLPK